MTLSFIGGDARMSLCARRFREVGATVHEIGLEGMPASPLSALASSHAVILPLPVTKDGLHPTARENVPTFSEIFASLPPGALVLGGQVPPSLSQEAKAAGVRLIDYYLDEALLSQNAYATAEAAVGMAALALPLTLRGTPLAILGSGRIARALCDILLALGARVSAYARNPVALASLAARGAHPVLFGEGAPLVLEGTTRAVFSTVPAPILDGNAIKHLAPGTPIYDLGGGGVCRESAKMAGLQLPDSSRLPGRYSPESAADYLFDAILRILQKEVKTE